LSPRIRESRGMMSKNGTSISLSQMMVCPNQVIFCCITSAVFFSESIVFSLTIFQHENQHKPK
jgi:hypothetical protein